MTKNNADIQALCAEWQKILRLQDWGIKITFERHWRMAPNRAGECSMVVNKKIAVIFILDPIDYSNDYVCSLDPERTVVHELVHLHLASNVSTLPETTEEQAVESLASAFVRLKRFW